jgi:spermidine/putrescine transport system permease protein
VKRNYGPAYTLPVAAWISAFFMVPIAIIFLYSFLKKGMYGGVIWRFSTDAYAALVNPALLSIAGATLFQSVIATAMTIALAIPAAYFIARSRHKNFFLFLVIIPFWTNFLIRIYAWIAILGNNGYLNNFLLSLRLMSSPTQFLYNQYAVIIVMVYTYLPFAILPLFATIEKFDFSLLEAAQDLGATTRQAMSRVLIPNIKSGIVTAVLFTFIPAFGQYAIPQLVGGRDSFMLGNVIARELTVSRNWPLSSAISVVLTVMTMIGVLVFVKFQTGAGPAAKAQSVKKAA